MTTEIAFALLNMALSLATEKNMKISVAVFDQNCHLASFVRMPDSYVGSVNSAIEKARSACLYRKSTKDFEDAVLDGRVGILKAADLIPIAGGNAIHKNKNLIGSIGISGAKAIEDHELGIKTIKSLKYD
jgi:glc operon protein GlcG